MTIASPSASTAVLGNELHLVQHEIVRAVRSVWCTCARTVSLTVECEVGQLISCGVGVTSAQHVPPLIRCHELVGPIYPINNTQYMLSIGRRLLRYAAHDLSSWH